MPFVLLCLLALGVSTCSGPVQESALLQKEPGETWIRTELLFGLSRPGGAPVSEQEWRDFLGQEVTPRFPDGLTVVEAYGQYLNSAKTQVREGSKLLLILYPPDPASSAKIEQIRTAYKKRFHQESVLRSTSLSKVSF